MNRSSRRLSRPVYESLPWLYAGCGLALLLGSYLIHSRPVTLALALVGFAGLLLGSVILLRRRDYRQMRASYGELAKLTGEPRDRDENS